MKKIIAIVLMLCLMIPTCFADTGDFKEDFVYVMNNLSNPDSKLYYSYTDYDEVESLNAVTITYDPDEDIVYVGISKKNGFTYWYISYNLFGTLMNASAVASVMEEGGYYNVAYVCFVDFSKWYMVSAYSFSTSREIEQYSAFTTFEDFTSACIEYACGYAAINRMYNELNKTSM